MRRAAVCLALAVSALIAAPAFAGEEGGKPKTTFVEIRPLTATLMRPGGRRGALTVELGLDAPDPRLQTLASESTPRLRDAYLRVVQAYALSLAPGSTPSADYLAIVLQRETDRVLGRKGAKVLLGAVLAN